MLKSLANSLFSVLGSDSRSINLSKNILASVFVKGLSIIVGFLMVRVSLDYLSEIKYGIWLTVSSFLTWFAFFEIGLGNGLRNKLAEALALKKYKLAKIYVSTTYAILFLIIGGFAIVFFICNSFIDWTVVLNSDPSLGSELRALALIVFSLFFLNFVLRLISVVLFADQKPALANSLNPIANLLALICVFIISKTTSSNSIVYLGAIIGSMPILVFIVTSILLYRKKYRLIAPSPKYVIFKYAKPLVNLGLGFFLIQISGLIIYQSSNMIIIQFFGAEDVTIYNIAHKYFSIITMGFSIITIPYWSAFTEAWALKDLVWIKKTIRKLLIIWLIISLVGIIQFIFSDYFYRLWIGDQIIIPKNLSLVLLIYFITFTFGGVFNMFINGVGKIRLQMISSVIGSLLFIGIALLFIKSYSWGIIGLVVASIISNFYGLILCPIQYQKIISKTAKGIWLK